MSTKTFDPLGQANDNKPAEAVKPTDTQATDTQPAEAPKTTEVTRPVEVAKPTEAVTNSKEKIPDPVAKSAVPEKPSASIEIATQSGKAASAHYSSLL